MCKCQILVIILLELLLNLELVDNECIFLNDCAVALKYIKKERNEESTINILKNAHCGFGDASSDYAPKIFCDQIPDFPELPADCVKFINCPPAMELIEVKPNDENVIELLRSSGCGSSAKKDLILCDRFASQSLKLGKLNLLPKPNECGTQPLTSRIRNGRIAEEEEFPWLALIRYKNDTGHMMYRCHGSLINNKYVITAAHCLKVPKSLKAAYGNLYSVVLGEYNITSTENCLRKGKKCAYPIQEFSVEHFQIHQKFGTYGSLNDIALIRLNGTVIFKDHIKPICLPVHPFELKLIKNESLLISGWGITENRKPSNVKLKAKIYYVTMSDCRNIDHSKLCAGSTDGTDTCRGDSGGPLMVLRPFDDVQKIVMAGVVSHGGQCGSETAFYTNVSLYVDWILENMQP